MSPQGLSDAFLTIFLCGLVFTLVSLVLGMTPASEIVYRKGNSRFTSGARCTDERAVAKGTEVVILRYERGIA